MTSIRASTFRFACALTVAGALAGSACEKRGCPTLLRNVPFQNFVPCCGATSTFRDITVSEKHLMLGLSNTSFPARPGVVDAYLTEPACARLFDGPYPGSPPLCRVLSGPVAPGQAGTVKEYPNGTYRVFAQGYTANENPATFLIDIEVWGDAVCGTARPLATAPSR